MRRKKTPSPRGFTLLEVLIAVLILGIIAAGVVPVIGGYAARAREARLDANIREIDLAQERYILEHRAPLAHVLTESGLEAYGIDDGTWIRQLLEPTDRDGNAAGAPISESPGPYLYGPYINDTVLAPASLLLGQESSKNKRKHRGVVTVVIGPRTPIGPEATDSLLTGDGLGFIVLDISQAWTGTEPYGGRTVAAWRLTSSGADRPLASLAARLQVPISKALCAKHAALRAQLDALKKRLERALSAALKDGRLTAAETERIETIEAGIDEEQKELVELESSSSLLAPFYVLPPEPPTAEEQRCAGLRVRLIIAQARLDALLAEIGAGDWEMRDLPADEVERKLKAKVIHIKTEIQIAEIELRLKIESLEENNRRLRDAGRDPGDAGQLGLDIRNLQEWLSSLRQWLHTTEQELHRLCRLLEELEAARKAAEGCDRVPFPSVRPDLPPVVPFVPPAPGPPVPVGSGIGFSNTKDCGEATYDPRGNAKGTVKIKVEEGTSTDYTGAAYDGSGNQTGTVTVEGDEGTRTDYSGAAYDSSGNQTGTVTVEGD